MKCTIIWLCYCPRARLERRVPSEREATLDLRAHPVSRVYQVQLARREQRCVFAWMVNDLLILCLKMDCMPFLPYGGRGSTPKWTVHLQSKGKGPEAGRWQNPHTAAVLCQACCRDSGCEIRLSFPAWLFSQDHVMKCPLGADTSNFAEIWSCIPHHLPPSTPPFPSYPHTATQKRSAFPNQTPSLYLRRQNQPCLSFSLCFPRRTI